MKTITNTLLILLLLIIASCSNNAGKTDKTKQNDSTNHEAEDELSSIPYNYGKTDSLLWQISGNGLSKPSYLFGTVHIIPKDDFFVSEDLIKKFRESEQLVLEIDLGSINMLGLGNLEGLSLPEGVSLKTLLSSEDYKYLDNFFKDSLGMGLDLFNKANLKPIFLSTLISQQANMEGTESYEMVLTSWAKMKSKEVKGLETLEFQLSIFDSIPYEKQAEMLIESVRNFGQSKDEISKLYEHYKNNELSKLVDLSNDSESDLMDYEDILLITRNTNWIPLIEELAREKPSFFAVGALHLPGKNGVITLLKEKGYTVKPVSLNTK